MARFAEALPRRFETLYLKSLFDHVERIDDGFGAHARRRATHQRLGRSDQRPFGPRESQRPERGKHRVEAKLTAGLGPDLNESGTQALVHGEKAFLLDEHDQRLRDGRVTAWFSLSDEARAQDVERLSDGGGGTTGHGAAQEMSGGFHIRRLQGAGKNRKDVASNDFEGDELGRVEHDGEQLRRDQAFPQSPRALLARDLGEGTGDRSVLGFRTPLDRLQLQLEPDLDDVKGLTDAAGEYAAGSAGEPILELGQLHAVRLEPDHD